MNVIAKKRPQYWKHLHAHGSLLNNVHFIFQTIRSRTAHRNEMCAVHTFTNCRLTINDSYDWWRDKDVKAAVSQHFSGGLRNPRKLAHAVSDFYWGGAWLNPRRDIYQTEASTCTSRRKQWQYLDIYSIRHPLKLITNIGTPYHSTLNNLRIKYATILSKPWITTTWRLLPYVVACDSTKFDIKIQSKL
jgi:hypothetical protein